MTVRLSDHEWEMLSAYLDSSLSLQEKKHVEDRLAVDSNYKEALISLARTRGILRAVPAIKRRRNFYLTPDMVRPGGWHWLLPFMNYSSAAAGLLAVIFLVMDLLPASMKVIQVQPVLEAAPLHQESAPQTAPQAFGVEITPVTELNSNEEEPKTPVIPAAPDAAKEGYAAGSSGAGISTGAGAASTYPSTTEQAQKSALLPESTQPAAAAPMMKIETTGLPANGAELTLGGGSNPAATMVFQTPSTTPSISGMMRAAPDELPEAELAPPAVSQPADAAAKGMITPLPTEGNLHEKDDSSGAVPAENVGAPPSPKNLLPAPTRPTSGIEMQPAGRVETPASVSRPWPSSRIGGLFLLLSLGLGIGGSILRKRYHL